MIKFSPMKFASALALFFEIVGGSLVPRGEHPEVVLIKGPYRDRCTGTVVGPRAVLCSAHCVEPGKQNRIIIDGRLYYTETFQSPWFRTHDHDLAVLVADEDLEHTTPVRIGGTSNVGAEVVMYGRGCTEPGPSDDLLRRAYSRIERHANLDFITAKPLGGALCYGDSGGPAYAVSDETLAIGIGSKSDLKDRSYFARLDTAATKDFLTDLILKTKVEICGINRACIAP